MRLYIAGQRARGVQSSTANFRIRSGTERLDPRRSPIPVIFQCNKRDLSTAAPIEHIREQLGLDAQCQLFESTAPSGRGIRMAFIAALRAAIAHTEGLQELELPAASSSWH